jgi:hypothetical protein
VATLNELQVRFREQIAAVDAARTETLRIETDLVGAKTSDPGGVAALERALVEAEARRTVAEQGALSARIDLLGLRELADDPVVGLDGAFPIVLLPVRIETRFVGDAGQRALLVRVYPDDLHVDAHEPELTLNEFDAARRYWDRVWHAGGNRDTERAAFVELARTLEPRRAAWVAHVTAPDLTTRPATPTPDDQPLATPPVLAAVALSPSTMNRPAHATVLPDRWIVLGYRGGAEVARGVGRIVPDTVQLGLSPDAGPPVAGQPLEPGLRWLVDFDEAERIGMGIRIPVADQRGFDRLLVLGVRTSLDPTASATRLTALLDAHRYSDGLAFIPPGTPTNNTDSARSRWDALPNAEELFELQQELPGGATSNAVVAASALGIDAATFHGSEHAADADQADARDMRIALWPATLGYFLETMLAPRVTDADVEAAREQFVNHVRGLGPLPAVRIGSQPYGLLPTTAISRWRPDAGDSTSQLRIVGLLRQTAPEWLARTRTSAPSGVPRVGRPGSQPDEEMLVIFGREALSLGYRVRPLRGPAFAESASPYLGSPDPVRAELVQAAFAVADAADLQVRVRGIQFDPRARRIQRPLVQHAPLSETDPVPAASSTVPNYLRWLSDRRERTQEYPGADRDTILYALARHSARLADADAVVRFDVQENVAARKTALEPELVDPSTIGAVSPTLGRVLAQPVSTASGGSIVSTKTAGEYLATTSRAEVAGLRMPHLLDAFDRSFFVRLALRRLSGRPSALIDRLAREVLDTCSHRLDAWITSYATRRLDRMRAANPTGLHIGGYAWVEDLRPKPPLTPVATPPRGERGPLFEDPANAGFIHAPSLGHAAAAAVLRSGHLSHARAGEPDGPLSIDLSSERVRIARWLIDGVRQGQPLGALLGYRFERGLHDRSGPGLELDRFIRRFRALAPLVAGRREPVQATVGAVEAVAAANVVDGLALLRRVTENPASIRPVLQAEPAATAAERQAIEAELAALGDAIDAIADVLLAEATYQLVDGSPTRAAATVDALGSGLGEPPELEIATTPRQGWAYTNRIVTLVGPSTAPADGWQGSANRPRRIAEPRLDRWAGTLLGPARRIRAAALLTPPAGGQTRVRELDLAATGLCALDLVYDTQVGTTSAVEQWVLDRIARSPGAGIRPGTTLQILRAGDEKWPGATWPEDVTPLEDALELAAALRQVLVQARPVTGGELMHAGATIATTVDAAEAAARATATIAAFSAAATAFRSAVTADGGTPTREAVATIRTTLGALAGFGVAAGQEAARSVTGPQVDDPTGDGRAVLDSAVIAENELVAMEARLTLAGPEPVSRVRAVFGERFAMAPLFAAPDPDALGDALTAATQPAFLDGDPGAPLAWLLRIGRVRESVGRFTLGLVYAVPSSRGHRVHVAQLPAADHWVALPLGQREPPAAATSVVIHSTEAIDVHDKLAGLVVDEWVDVIPARTITTGLTFNFDEPGARAPHAILVAVPPAPVERWSLDTLAAVIRETADLARIRMVGPEETPWFGRIVPALYFADNRSGDTLHVDFHELVRSPAI